MGDTKERASSSVIRRCNIRLIQCYIKGKHARDFIVRFKSSYIIGFLRILRYRRKRNVSLRVFGESASFHSAYLPKMNNSTSSLNTLYTAESAQFYSTFVPTTISWTPCFCRKHEVWLIFFTESAQNDPKTHSYEDDTKFNPTFSATTVSCALCFWRKQGEW